MAEPDAAGEAGFTLVEMLVSLALLSLLVLLLLQGTWSAARLTRTLAAAERQEGVRAVREHLRRVVGDAVAESGPGREAVFAGAGDALTLVTGAERLIEAGGQVRVRLALRPGAAGAELVETRGLDRGTWAEAAPPETLLRDVAEIRLRYYGRQGPTPQLAWSDAWPPSGRLPVLVSVAVRFRPGDGRSWTPLILPVAAAR